MKQVEVKPSINKLKKSEAKQGGFVSQAQKTKSYFPYEGLWQSPQTYVLKLHLKHFFNIILG